MTQQGFIKLYRKIQDHPFYMEKRKFSKYEAWIDLIMMANHKDNSFLFGNKIIEVAKGQFITSIRKLCDKWEWSNSKVVQFLELLMKQEMIVYKSDTKKTVITIVNYGVYHDKEEEKTTVNRHENDSKQIQKHTNKNVKNDKKKEYAEFVSMTEKEFDSLVEKYGKEPTNKMIEILDNYKGSKGKTYKSDYRAILNWVVEKVVTEKPSNVVTFDAETKRKHELQKRLQIVAEQMEMCYQDDSKYTPLETEFYQIKEELKKFG